MTYGRAFGEGVVIGSLGYLVCLLLGIGLLLGSIVAGIIAYIWSHYRAEHTDA